MDLLDERTRINLLMDVYGPLLTERQIAVCRMYYQDDMSLSEISMETNVSRQGVHNLIKRSHERLEEIDGKLGFISRYNRWKERLARIADSVENKGDQILAEEIRGCILWNETDE